MPVACIVPTVPFDELKPGEITHLASGVIFPEKLGAFRRREYRGLDWEGLDVSIAYTRLHLVDRLNATYFVYPAIPVAGYDAQEDVPRDQRKVLLEQSFSEVKRDLLEYNPGAKLVFEDHSVVMFQGKERDTLLANYIYSEKLGFLDIQFFTTASLMAVDEWLILNRLTAPDDSVGRSTKEISAFIQEFMEINGGHLFPAGYGDDAE